MGCGSDDSGGAPAGQTGLVGAGGYKGLLSGGVESGVLNISVVPAGSQPQALGAQDVAGTTMAVSEGV